MNWWSDKTLTSTTPDWPWRIGFFEENKRRNDLVRAKDLHVSNNGE